MQKYFGKSILRNEDERLLTGQALFVDDVHLNGMLHVGFLRSDYAHGKINSIDVSEALKRPGVIAIYTAEELGDYWQHGPLLVPPPPTIEKLTFNERTQIPLAKDKVRHVGEPLAVVVAESRYIAEDALGDIFADIDPYDAVVDIETALSSDAVLIHEDLESNLAAHVIQEKGDYDSIKKNADLIIKRKFYYDRGAAAAMENRGIVADWDEKGQHLTIWDTTQAPIPIRNGLAGMLGLSQNQVRVIAPFIGGGFGPKIMMFYPEEVLIPWISIQLKRPVKWIEDRQENFFATTQERGQVHDAEIALTKEGKILGVHDVFIHDTGAYNPYGLTVPINSQCTLLGPYNVPNYYTEFKVVYTNKTIVTPVRGAGRQQGVFVMERLLDFAAKELAMDLVEIRKKNFLKPDEFPHDHKIIFQDFAPLVYDSGNYEPSLVRAAEMIGFDKIQNQKSNRKGNGKLQGVGIVSYIEGTGIGPYEGARVYIDPSGEVNLATGVGTQGQGHFTSFAQIVSEVLSVDVSNVKVTTGDTSEFNWGTGTFASRGAVVAGNACHAAALKVRDKIIKLAVEVLETDEENLELDSGKVLVISDKSKNIPLGELAKLANPLRGAVKPGTEPGLEATAYFGPASGSTANGAHAMIVEVDTETMLVKIKKYVVVHDCGKVINPMILEGQIQGGVAQGIGNSFYEQLVYDDNGQLLNASFMDYLLPTSLDVPNIESDHTETPSPFNPLGVKGAGEAGAIPTGALFAQAVENALSRYNLEICEIPLNPNRLFELMEEVRNK